MKLNMIVNDEQDNTFVVIQNDNIENSLLKGDNTVSTNNDALKKLRLLNCNRNLVASTNIDVSTMNSTHFESLESLGIAMNELAVSQLSHKLKQFGENQDSVKGFVNKFDMCHRGTVPTICVVNRYVDVTVLSISDNNPDECHVTRFFKIGATWEHSFEVQSKSMHVAYPAMIQAQL
ncbi:hypothetical protein ABWJ26_000742 [Vibrio fluvialis]